MCNLISGDPVAALYGVANVLKFVVLFNGVLILF